MVELRKAPSADGPGPASSGGGGGRRPPFAAFVADEMARRLVARLAEERGWSLENVYAGTVAQAVATLEGAPTPQLLIIDLSDSADPIADVNLLADTCDPGTTVIGLGMVNDVNLFRQLMTLGLADYLLKPLTAEMLEASIAQVLQEDASAPEGEADRKARMMVVFGTRGGCGASTVASNLAWALAHDLEARTLLVDLDVLFGTASLAMDLEPGRGLREALENPARVDSLFMERAMVKESDRLDVLAAEEPGLRPLSMDPEALDLILDSVRADRQWVVVDAPRSLLPEAADVLAKAETLILVTDMTLAGMRDTLRMMKALRQRAPHARLRLIGNKAGLLKKGELDRVTFQKGIDEDLALLLPFDAQAAAASIEKGRPLAEAAPGSKPAKALRAFARTLNERRQRREDAPKSLLDRLLRKRAGGGDGAGSAGGGRRRS